MFRTIIEKAREENHPLVKKAFQQELQWRTKTTAELDNVFLKLKEVTENTDNIPITQAQVLAKLRSDLELTKKLKAILRKEQYKPGINVTWAVKTNKMEEILTGTQNLVQIDNDFAAILNDYTVPMGYQYQTLPEDITYVGENTTTLYGSSKGTFLKTALLTAYQIGTRKTRLQELNLLPTQNAAWIDESAMVHVSPLPADLDLLSLDDGFAHYSYFFSDNITPQGLAFVHSGYAFGGHRNEPRYPKGKLFGPEDCSSWLAKLCNTETFSTLDQLFHYRLHMREGIVDPTWREGPTPAMLADCYEVRDPQKDICPGQIYCHRVFNKEEDPTLQNSPGTGGHTTLVLGFASAGSDSKIVTIGDGRNMPTEEGLGIQAFPFNPPDNRKVMLFMRKNFPSSEAETTVQQEIKFSTAKDLKS